MTTSKINRYMIAICSAMKPTTIKQLPNNYRRNEQPAISE